MFHFRTEILFFEAAHRGSDNKTIINKVYFSWISDCGQRNKYQLSGSRFTWSRPAYAAIQP